jgi:hypothetical protein
MSIEVISFILLRIMPVIFIICFVFYLVNAFRYPLNADWMPYECKAGICLAGVILLMCVDLLEIKNLVVLIVILGLTIILLIWTIFTNVFHKQEEKNRLYRELIYVWNQEDLTDFQKHMSREEQIAFLKSIKKTQTVSINGKEEEIYEEIHLIADDAQLKFFEPILRKEIKL